MQSRTELAGENFLEIDLPFEEEREIETLIFFRIIKRLKIPQESYISREKKNVIRFDVFCAWNKRAFTFLVHNFV